MASKRQPLFNSVSTVLCLIGIAVFQVDISFILNSKSPMAKAYGGQWNYLTNLGVAASYLTIIFGFFANLTGSKALFNIKNRLLLISAPVEVLISILYGSLCLINRDLVVPPELKSLLPLRIDLCLHMFPAIILSCDYLLFSPPWATSGIGVLGLYSLIGTGYWFWIHHTFAVNKFYPYPILNKASEQQMIFIFTVSVAIYFLAFIGLRAVYSLTHPSSKGTIDEKKVK
ncbi:FAR-17a/AIG1-like protein [Dipodascopsis uninucleata]